MKPAPLRALIQRACATGASMAEIRTALDRQDDSLAVYVCQLVNRGHLIAVGKPMQTRYFARQSDAQKYRNWLSDNAEALEAERKRHQAKVRADKIARRRSREVLLKRNPAYPLGLAALPKTPTVMKQAQTRRKLPVETVVPEGVKRTVQAAPPGRYAVQGPVIGGFATMGIGRYLGVSK